MLEGCWRDSPVVLAYFRGLLCRFVVEMMPGMLEGCSMRCRKGRERGGKEGWGRGEDGRGGW